MTRLTGGCQCGAVRFAVEEWTAKHASICHCRMCQKAFGSLYGPLVTVDPKALTWTRGEPKRWRSSNVVSRGFCADCGTPLTYEPDEEWISLAIGAFDDPTKVAPKKQFGTESKLPFVDHLADLPGKSTEDTVKDAAWIGNLHSNQHPDHDTAEWVDPSP